MDAAALKRKRVRPQIEKNLERFGDGDNEGSQHFLEDEMKSYESMSSVDSYDDDQTRVKKRRMTHMRRMTNQATFKKIQEKKAVAVLGNAAKFLEFLKKKEREIKKQENKFLINPESKFKTIWDHFQIVLIIYLSTASPFKMAFFEDGTFPKWDIAEFVIDFFILIDIILTFFTPIWIKYQLINKHAQIARVYLKFWFWMDLFSIIPMAEIIQWFSLSDSLAKFSNIPKLYRLFKLSKLIRALRMQKKGDTYVGRLLKKFRKSDTLLGSIVPLYVFGILVAYIFACIWYFIPNINPSRKSWLLRYDYESEATHDKFWASMYYVYSTVTTTGYGDILPDDSQEFGMTLLFMACGVTFYSMIYTIIIRRIEKHTERS